CDMIPALTNVKATRLETIIVRGCELNRNIKTAFLKRCAGAVQTLSLMSSARFTSTVECHRASLDQVLWGEKKPVVLPPLMAGTIEISVPGGMGVASPPVYRTSSFPTKILMCSRICPCSVTTRSRIPGQATHSACNASE